MNLPALLAVVQAAVSIQHATPVLAFPEPGVDDVAAYEGYRTRFHRDAARNAVQVYIKETEGRVVHLWADAANASAGFTARDAAGRPARLEWASDTVLIGSRGVERVVEYRLAAEAGELELGAFLLESMRVERDFQHQGGHLRPWSEAAMDRPELTALIENVERLDGAERRRHLDLLAAADAAELRSRLRAAVAEVATESGRAFRIERRTFDGRNLLALEIEVESGSGSLDGEQGILRISAAGGGPIRLAVRATTDNGILAPLRAEEILNAEFLAYVERIRAGDPPGPAAGAMGFGGAAEAGGAAHRIDRQIRSLELVSYEEKLMAGLPNYGTYFGRDMIMSALMMEPIWTVEMVEHVVASVLRKLSPDGAVSHEEALGGQAIREHAVVYHRLVDAYFEARAEGDADGAAELLARAWSVLAGLQQVRENYHMVDDDFQFPVLAARYLGNPDIPGARKRAFLLADGGAGDTRLVRLLRNLAYVLRRAGPYAADPVPTNLIGFERRPDGLWYASSWRDSGAGYGNGRYAMDVNAIWVPQALAAVERILAGLAAAGFPVAELAADHDDAALDVLWDHARDRSRLRSALKTWRGARAHFMVELPADEVRERVSAWLTSLPAAESEYWLGVLESTGAGAEGIRFPALSLDSVGEPIPVVNTDPAMRLFLEDMTAKVLAGVYEPEEVLAEVEPFVLAYPVGLFVPGIGPLVANDAYASPDVWRRFRDDHYHSPQVVWGREVNLLKLGLARQIASAYDEAGRLRDPRLEAYVERLADALRLTVEAVEASGFKDNELWTYRIEAGQPSPLRYPISTDIQLWNLTDLAVQYVLSRLPVAAERPAGAGAPRP